MSFKIHDNYLQHHIFHSLSTKENTITIPCEVSIGNAGLNTMIKPGTSSNPEPITIPAGSIISYVHFNGASAFSTATDFHILLGDSSSDSSPTAITTLVSQANVNFGALVTTKEFFHNKKKYVFVKHTGNETTAIKLIVYITYRTRNQKFVTSGELGDGVKDVVF